MSRKKKQIKTKNDFYIITNGEKTENLYFNLLKCKKSLFKVHIKIQNKDPFALVQYASDFLENANQVWCVFDVDQTYESGRLEEALQLAKKTNIHCAVSNISFEVWLVSHYEPLKDYKTESQLEDKLKELLKKPYLKNDEQLIKSFIPKYKDAINNSKIIYQTWEKDNSLCNGISPIWKWNSCTNVFQLVEALKLQVN